MATARSGGIEDRELVDAVAFLYERHEVDNGNGGVHPSYVAAYLETEVKYIRPQLRQLCSRGALARVQGIDPATGLTRGSYAPPNAD